MRFVNAAALFLILLAPLGWAPKARAQIDWLVLVVDRSGSISQEQMAIQRTAYARVLSDPEVVAMLDGAQVAIVEFDSAPEVLVDWSKPEVAAAAYEAARMPPKPGLTGIGAALATALELLEGRPGRSVIDISANGRENVDSATLLRAREAAARRSIEINGLVFLNPHDPGLEAYFLDHVVNGFLSVVEHSGHFLAALRAKLALEIASADHLAPRRPDT